MCQQCTPCFACGRRVRSDDDAAAAEFPHDAAAAVLRDEILGRRLAPVDAVIGRLLRRDRDLDPAIVAGTAGVSGCVANGPDDTSEYAAI